MEEALRVIVKEAQWDVYRESMQQLTCNKQLNNSDPLSSLHPFLDEFGLLRVGGWLEASNLTYDTKHPIILPYGHYVTRLILNDLHHNHLHAGPQGLIGNSETTILAYQGQSSHQIYRAELYEMRKGETKLMTQFMGNLPAHRVQPARPFTNTGIDFVGPLWIHFKGSGNRPQKAYLAVFCCFATKAVHLELVTNLTTEAFINALKRFIGRRGHCRNLYCDNATNFVGAKIQLAELNERIYGEQSQEQLINYSTKIASFRWPVRGGSKICQTLFNQNHVPSKIYV
ncbi:uncharacterized protein LOC119648466 [Hermetia illucens]|uniref:uncharacterized protein LOC119648466 n=1 Tax=Hermetia illucens TaxID=343691 RepID=UPI0018CC100E|nr:uncharacterized protein LOC119648466 [Hermetia illucens]